jgi:hypothetical protein
MRVIVLCLFLIGTIGCTSKENIAPNDYKATIQYLNAQDLSLEEKETIVNELNTNENIFPYYQAFDTLAYLEKLNLQTEVNYINDSITEKLDTLTLQFMAYACFCPQWRDVEHINDDRYTWHGFYLKPAVSEILLPSFFMAGTRITFIGRIEDNRHLEEPKGSDPIPGRELYYYSYTIHKPYSFWGESVFMSYNVDIITDTIKGDFLSREITVD